MKICLPHRGRALESCSPRATCRPTPPRLSGPCPGRDVRSLRPAWLSAHPATSARQSCGRSAERAPCRHRRGSAHAICRYARFLMLAIRSLATAVWFAGARWLGPPKWCSPGPRLAISAWTPSSHSSDPVNANTALGHGNGYSIRFVVVVLSPASQSVLEGRLDVWMRHQVFTDSSPGRRLTLPRLVRFRLAPSSHSTSRSTRASRAATSGGSSRFSTGFAKTREKARSSSTVIRRGGSPFSIRNKADELMGHPWCFIWTARPS